MTSMIPQEGPLGEHERRIALALAEAAMPAVSSLGGANEATLARYEGLLDKLGPEFARIARGGLWAAEAWPVTRSGRPFTMLSRADREAVLTRWSESSSRHERWLLRAIMTPLKSAHFDDAHVFRAVSCRRDFDTPAVAERARWMEQVTDGRGVERDLELTCEVVVIGTGAGGAAAAYELAKRGRAVLLLEGGHLPQRTDFRGRSSDAYRHLYASLGSSIALGNVGAPILAGRGVGGSTAINSGTCYRAPEHTLERWGERYGLTMLAPDLLAPYYERVESMLGVAEVPPEHLGGSARVIARGAELLQLSHRPLRRNAPGCDGQGVCCFGCPTGAKRSTDVSYVPEALKRGAQLVTGARVERIVTERGRTTGAVARLSSGRTLTVHADAVVVAGGALGTPLLLARSGLCASSGWLGKNLSIHPATKVMALFDEVIDMSRGVPQSYAVESYAREGIMFEGASAPLDVAAVAVPWVGARFMELMASYPNLATFGLMIQDRSRGEVRAGAFGAPLIRYSMSREDFARMQRGVETLCEIFLKAGAKRVLPMVPGCEEIASEDDLARLRRLRLGPGDFDVSAYHPLGTCRMGTDPKRSCVGPDGAAHDVEGLWVADGSVIPSSLGANPQMTIMALALRTSEALDARLDARPRPSPRGDAPALAFEETMSGTLQTESERETRPFSFALRARSRGLADFAATREVEIEGELMAEGFGARCPLTGTLGMDVLVTGKLPYDFTFTSDDGRSFRFVGEKTLDLAALSRSMTVLPGRVLGEGGVVVGRAEVTFDLDRDLLEFLRSFRVEGGASWLSARLGTAYRRMRAAVRAP
ncbi:MAG: FAD-dependent oxidoreductase [Deltaproteobacteria bacterium]|nr:FAD-dependent oxidoreductase [Deltaproteobacteria bacterium]